MSDILDKIIEAAKDPEIDRGKLESIMAFHSTIREAETKRLFDGAMAKAKAKLEPIVKSEEVSFSRTTYKYETLPEIDRIVDPILSEYGLYCSYRSYYDDAGLVISCVITHEEGYFKETPIRPRGYDNAGNSLQNIGSTITYLQRYTKKLALGLSAGKDDDGISGGGNITVALVNSEEIAILSDLIQKSGADERRVFAHAGVSRLSEIKQSDFDGLRKALLAKVSAREKESQNAPAN